MFSAFSKYPKVMQDLQILEIALHHGRSTVAALQWAAYSGLASQADIACELGKLDAAGKLTPRQKDSYDFGKLMNTLNSELAKTAVDSAILIYAHSILDTLIFRLCGVSVSADPDAWIPLIRERKVSFHQVQSTSTVSELQLTLLKVYLEQLERQSLLVKCDTLFKVTKPARIQGILSKYRYSRERLTSLDKTRHDLIHKLKFHQKIRRATAKVGYLLNTGQFFINLMKKHFQ
jgi:hypothetical protein